MTGDETTPNDGTDAPLPGEPDLLVAAIERHGIPAIRDGNLPVPTPVPTPEAIWRLAVLYAKREAEEIERRRVEQENQQRKKKGLAQPRKTPRTFRTKSPSNRLTLSDAAALLRRARGRPATGGLTATVFVALARAQEPEKSDDPEHLTPLHELSPSQAAAAVRRAADTLVSKGRVKDFDTQNLERFARQIAAEPNADEK